MEVVSVEIIRETEVFIWVMREVRWDVGEEGCGVFF